MIVVLGRPGLGRPAGVGPDALATEELDGRVARIGLAAAAAGGSVEIVGSIGDDVEGDRVVVLLGREGIGHAALLRDPAGRTAVAGQVREPAPRLDAGDVDLGLRYLSEISVLVLAEPLPPEAESVALGSAEYHAAPVTAIVPAGSTPSARLAATATVFEAPDDAEGPFAAMVGRYAAALANGVAPADAFTAATREGGWERAGE
ncbi:MAG: hypothetical protein H0V04_08445 [Chloroflexi bacterium]|nr:hypothetical protein [Chloroflexota bacterium]